MVDLTLRERCEKRLVGLKATRKPWEHDWRSIAKLAAPSRSKFLHTGQNPRRLSNIELQDGHGIRAFRTLMAGMTSGLSSPSRPWFRLTLEDEDMLDSTAKAWLETVENRMYGLFARTNFYDAAKSGYWEIGLFGTEACVMVEHWRQGAVCHPLTAGEYWIDEGDENTPDTLYRHVRMTVLKAVEMFGVEQGSRDIDWTNFDQSVKTLYDQSNYTATIECHQAIEPNPEWSPQYNDFRGKRWRSIWWHTGCGDKEKLLKQSGFNEQPFWAPRWGTTSSDIYGIGPGHEALPDLRVLQAQAVRKGQATDVLVDPELAVPASVAAKVTGRPGNRVGIANEDISKIGPFYTMPYQALQMLTQDVEQTRQKVDQSAYADLFNAITNMPGVQPRTVEEIAARNEEKLTQLGPVIERVNVEKLQVAIERAYGILSRGGLLPPVPDSLHMMPLKIDFVSILTQMQRIIGLGQIERPMGFVGNLSAAFPSVIDKIDPDAVVDEYFERAGAPPRLLRSADAVAQIRQSRAQQQAAQQAAATMPAVKDGAEAANTLAQTDTGGGRTALQNLIGQ